MPNIKEEMDKSAQETSPQTLDRAEVADFVWGQYTEAKSNRDLEQDLLRGRTLKEYIDDNVKRFVQYKKRPAHKRNWQSNLASTTPNEKLIGILSKLAMRGMEAVAFSMNELNNTEFFKEKLANYMLKHGANINDDDFQVVLEMMEASEKGTVIGMEDWYFGTIKAKELTNLNPETGEFEYTEKEINEWNDVRSRIINLEDFVPGDVMVRPGAVADMDDCYLRSIMSEDEFKTEFGGYIDADKVTTMEASVVDNSTPFWKNSEDVKSNQIEVVRKFDKKNDEYVILANKIWINPKGKHTVSPLPWRKYGRPVLPFWAAVFEPFDAGFFYGRSIIDKLVADCDSKDGLFDRIMDQATLSVSNPVLADGQTASAMTKGFLQPNNVITTDWSDGTPKFQVLPIPEPSTSSVALYQIMAQRNEQSIVASEVIGGTGGKGKTATQIEVEQQAAMELVSLFLKLMEKGAREKNILRLANQVQFYALPIEGKEYKRIVLRDQKLSSGKSGVVQISVVDKVKDNKVEDSLQRMEIIEIEPRALKSMEMDIKIVMQSSIGKTEVQRQISEINYQKIMMEMYADKFDRDYGFDELNRKFGKDVSSARTKQPQMMPGMPGAVPGQPGQQPGQQVKQPERKQVNEMSTV